METKMTAMTRFIILEVVIAILLVDGNPVYNSSPPTGESTTAILTMESSGEELQNGGEQQASDEIHGEHRPFPSPVNVHRSSYSNYIDDKFHDTIRREQTLRLRIIQLLSVVPHDDKVLDSQSSGVTTSSAGVEKSSSPWLEDWINRWMRKTRRPKGKAAKTGGASKAGARKGKGRGGGRTRKRKAKLQIVAKELKSLTAQTSQNKTKEANSTKHRALLLKHSAPQQFD